MSKPDEASHIRSAKLEAVLRTAVSAIVSIDDKGIIDSINPATTTLFGYREDELIGRNVKILMPEPYAGEHDRYLADHISAGVKKIIGIGREVSGRRKDGSIFSIHLAVSEYTVADQRHFTGIITDLTDRNQAQLALKESEDRLAQASRMEAVGQLAGGIAHDFNNLLSVITGSQEILEMRLKDEKDLALLARAQEAANMGARLIERLLTFARRKRLEPSDVNLNDQVTNMVEMLRRSVGAHISLRTNLAPQLWTVRADASEIENAIINLAINARDAMPEGGTLLIETTNRTLDGGKLAGGDFVQLTVSDTGVGMTPEVQARAFDPFFTTKEAGKGTGLGLSTIQGFVQQSGGMVQIYSEAGQGTTISIHLPRSTEFVAAPPESNSYGEAPMARGETILLAEDNPDVRAVARERLESLGFRVIVADTGVAAISALQVSDHAIHLVFSDVVMPGGVSGYDVARWVMAYAPGVKVILSSGYPEEVARAQQQPLPDVRLLRKPYTRLDLARALREALDAPPTIKR